LNTKDVSERILTHQVFPFKIRLKAFDGFLSGIGNKIRGEDTELTL
jgi:hypothetical protein